MEDIMTVRGFARVFGCSEAAVYHWIRNHEIDTVSIDGQMFIRSSLVGQIKEWGSEFASFHRQSKWPHLYFKYGGLLKSEA